MGFLLRLLSYGVALTSAGFIIFSLANGLLWIAELIEEHSRFAKSVGIRLTYGIILLHVALFFTETLPFHLLAFSSGCHIIYLQNFSTTWPMISLTSPTFIFSCIGVVADHFIWFTHFATQSQKSRQWARNRLQGSAPPHYTFWETTSFFATCVWLIPLFLFLSLSANDNALPYSTPARASAPGPSKGHRESRTSLFKTVFTLLPEAMIPKYLKSKNTPLPLLSPSASSFTRSQPISEFHHPEPPIRPSLSRTPSLSNDISQLANRSEMSPKGSSRRRIVASDANERLNFGVIRG